MSMPHSNPPSDQYSTDGQTMSQNWNAPYQPASSHTPAVYQPTAVPDQREDAKLERRAVTVRIVIALALAVPLTAIAGGMMGGGLSSLLGMALAWAGIALVVYLSHGKGFPFRS